MNSKTHGPAQPVTDPLRALSTRFSMISIRNAAVVILLLVGILVPRLVALDRLVTPDEYRWLVRSANFYDALSQGDLANTYQIEHPGVLTMWAGLFGFLSYFPAYSDQAAGQIEWWYDELGPFLKSHGYDPLELLVASRLNMILATALVLVVGFWLAIRLLGFWPAAIGFLLIALDPFHTALSRLLHVDGLSSTLALLSLLAFLTYLYRGKQKWDLVISGAAAGLAWLTKSPMLFLIPFAVLLVLLELFEKWRQQRRLVRSDLLQAFFPLIVWGSVGLAVFILLWPAMWVDPIHTLRRIGGAMVDYAGQGHDSQLFFNGIITEGDPGASFYPITYLWRTTPVVLLGLGLAIFAWVFPRFRLITPTQRRSLGMLLLFTLLFAVFMTLGAKKFDRYLLPVYLPLDLVAGVGWVAAVTWIRQQPQRWAQALAPVLLAGVVAGQVGVTVSSYPYYLSYYNPLLGGAARASEVMMVGWGEGLDQAAHFLNSQPGAVNRQVATGVWSTTFSYYYIGPVVSSRFEPGANVAEDWVNSDYYVLYINEKQRGKISNDLTDYLSTLKPVHRIEINGIDYVYIYDIRDLPPPDFLHSASNPQ